VKRGAFQLQQRSISKNCLPPSNRKKAPIKKAPPLIGELHLLEGLPVQFLLVVAIAIEVRTPDVTEILCHWRLIPYHLTSTT
jgi:hypothetical protein